MKLHACRRCVVRLRIHAELQEHLLTHPNVCVTCYRSFSRRVDLLAHKCKVEELLCKVCQRSYSTQTKLARHKRETPCGHSLPPEAKRQKLMPPIEDLEVPPLVFVNRILQHPIGCVGIVLPPHIKHNPCIIGLDKDYHSIPYVDNLCLFRCLGLHLGHEAKMLYAKYTDRPTS